ncbi:MAG TPA: EF-hand domain-containing protein [Pyrinomonadaceae bacterium]|nr:EF-hand domain-containing protein [Pyrinomonadaceae bacterium]
MFVKVITAIFVLGFSVAISAQRPGGGRPPIGQPGPGDRPPMGMPGQRPDHDGPKGDWIGSLDQNGDDRIDATELQTAIDRTFSEFDKNKDGSIGMPESGFRPERNGPENRNEGRQRRLLPPFFFAEELSRGNAMSKTDFERVVRGVFNEMDGNADGFIDQKESRPRIGGKPEGDHRMRPNAQFIAAELRFGDKLIKDKPFSAEMQIEDTRRLFDGSTVTKKINGATYRDTAGRTRREQPIDIAGIGVVGADNKPQMLVFINDFTARTQIFLDVNQKVARKTPLGNGDIPDPKPRVDAKTESLGEREIEGVRAVGTREMFEIPANQLGSSKPMQVVTEVWFSPDLQVIVMSKHTDPIAGEHVFRLVNIRRTEPAAALFEAPADYKVVGKPMRD